ncbi:energy-coupling factor transporter transmembrane protein EcfT [Candidatus Korarchaeum cryptofilum]|jgi:energy-coupling factor transport system permease protein|uniref:ABC-type cobalt transport system, permease component CbiQ or related transporter n=2 Tax=Candidatus Korarchaeum cryptofilum TaxID=498846 RepID=B1L3R6_KORCO|nr:energy-coupling factor transporter transmembrane component T [Candidatus Korarchaeum cryptofilum]ACB07095.1 ABC-type cobalt transport system, permease component CbiQ or related transporter [Candidatus Korarchaeum cryptofilum OPF8]RSN67679.1 energy-coupling factor transporter transmembrane protein EcfT [Candidatus Korarchaeum cryptofilum]
MTFKYVEKDTVIHKLHPMTKALLLLAALMLALIFTYDYSIIPLLIVLAFELIIWKIAGIEFWRVAIVIKVLLGIFLFFIIVQGFLYRGGVTPLFAIGHFKLWEKDIGEFTLEGLLYGIFISAKILVVVIAAIIFVMTTSITKMSALAHSLRLPYSFSFTLLAGLRFAPLIFKSFSDIKDAQKLRAFDIDRMNIIVRAFKAYVPILTPLILNLLRRGMELQISIESRGYGATKNPTQLEELQVRLWDYITFIIIIVVFASSVYVNYTIAPSLYSSFLQSLRSLLGG